MRIMLALGVITVCLAVHRSPIATADAASNKVIDFLFVEDNQIAATAEQLNASIEEKIILRNDKWWNEPLTRLDYALITIEADLNSAFNLSRSLIMKDTSEYFEKSTVSSLWTPPVRFTARYSETLGRLVLGAYVDGAGKPKKPMQQFCELVLKRVKHTYSLKPFGYAWRATLGILHRNNSEKYNVLVQSLAESAVLSATVSTTYENNGTSEVFIVGCMQQDANGPVTFSKDAA